MKAPDILALDFDGVVCDGLLEYFQTAWHTYCLFWQPANLISLDDLAPLFYRLRPVIETGWEMPVLIHALIQGIPEAEILANWHQIAEKILIEFNFKSEEIGAALDNYRDQWIANNLDDWLSYHRFYPGVINRIQEVFQSSTKVVIITTKEGRFVKQLFRKANVDFPAESIFGKELKRPKSQILQELIAASSQEPDIWFVEDRLNTLYLIKKEPNLAKVSLFLADWGYNTAQERQQAKQDSVIKLLSLSQFKQNFASWI